jgi:hypothetical protein
LTGSPTPCRAHQAEAGEERRDHCRYEEVVPYIYCTWYNDRRLKGITETNNINRGRGEEQRRENVIKIRKKLNPKKNTYRVKEAWQLELGTRRFLLDNSFLRLLLGLQKGRHLEQTSDLSSEEGNPAFETPSGTFQVVAGTFLDDRLMVN